MGKEGTCAQGVHGWLPPPKRTGPSASAKHREDEGRRPLGLIIPNKPAPGLPLGPAASRHALALLLALLLAAAGARATCCQGRDKTLAESELMGCSWALLLSVELAVPAPMTGLQSAVLLPSYFSEVSLFLYSRGN